jgi:hypothetical protein
MLRSAVLYGIAVGAIALLAAAIRRLRARVALDDAERILRKDMPDWK